MRRRAILAQVWIGIHLAAVAAALALPAAADSAAGGFSVLDARASPRQAYVAGKPVRLRTPGGAARRAVRAGYDPTLYGNVVIVRGAHTRRDYWYSHMHEARDAAEGR